MYNYLILNCIILTTVIERATCGTKSIIYNIHITLYYILYLLPTDTNKQLGLKKNGYIAYLF